MRFQTEKVMEKKKNSSKSNIEDKKRKFKITGTIALTMTILLTPIAIYLFFSLEGQLFGGIICLIIASHITITNIFYIQSRDKIEIIDYFSLRYYMHFKKGRFRKMFKYARTHLNTFLMTIIIITLFQLFWIFSITHDIYSFSSMGLFLFITKLPWNTQFHNIQVDALQQAKESDKIMKNCLKRIDQLTFTEVNQIEFRHLKSRMDNEQRIKDKHTQLVEQTSIEYNLKLYIFQAVLFESFGLISWLVINFWLV